MASTVDNQPAYHHQGIIPHLIVEGAKDAISFYEKAFGAKLLFSIPTPSDPNRLLHASLQINGMHLFLHDAFPKMGALDPKAIGGTSVTIHLSVTDCDAAWEKVQGAGGDVQVKMPIDDMGWGDRYVMFKDPFGHAWSIGSPLSPDRKEAAKKKWDEMMSAKNQECAATK